MAMIDRDILNLLLPWLGEQDVAGVERIDGGYVNDVYRVEATSGPFALRVYSPLTTREMACEEHALLKRVAAQMPEAPAPIPAPGVESDCPTLVGGASLSLFVEGRRPDRRDAAHRVEAARTLGRLHAVLAGLDDVPPRASLPALADLDWRRNRLWSWPAGKQIVIREAGEDAMATIDAGLAECASELARLAKHGWGRMPIHGDYYEGNLLMSGGRITGVVDWDEFRVDWRAWEISNAVWSFCRNAASDEFDRDAARAFLAAYEENGQPLLASERAETVTLIRLTRLWEALYTVGEAQRGGCPDWAYFAANLRAFGGQRGMDPI